MYMYVAIYVYIYVVTTDLWHILLHPIFHAYKLQVYPQAINALFICRLILPPCGPGTGLIHVIIHCVSACVYMYVHS